MERALCNSYSEQSTVHCHWCFSLLIDWWVSYKHVIGILLIAIPDEIPKHTAALGHTQNNVFRFQNRLESYTEQAKQIVLWAL